MSTSSPIRHVALTDPPFVQSLFGNTRWAILWFIARLYVGYSWLTSGWGKLNSPDWMQTGEGLKGFWQHAVQIPQSPARPPIAYSWYRDFIQFLLDTGQYTWFAKLISIGEFLVGIALILGLLTGFAAFFGGFMNWNFMMAGSASTNPVMCLLSILLILAWKTAGWYGIDRWLLLKLGTPWRPGMVLSQHSKEKESA